jgi:uncharacterized RDD family membrane protein YckC
MRAGRTQAATPPAPAGSRLLALPFSSPTPTERGSAPPMIDDRSLSRPAGLLRRLGAMIYDALLVIAIWMLTLLVLVIAAGGPAVGPFVQSLLFVELYGFFLFFWTRRGQTLGMVAWRLHIESVDGRPVTPLQATIRFIGAIASWVTLGIGYLWMYVDPGRRTWPDLVSDTQVIYTPKPKS